MTHGQHLPRRALSIRRDLLNESTKNMCCLNSFFLKTGLWSPIAHTINTLLPLYTRLTELWTELQYESGNRFTLGQDTSAHLLKFSKAFHANYQRWFFPALCLFPTNFNFSSFISVNTSFSFHKNAPPWHHDNFSIESDICMLPNAMSCQLILSPFLFCCRRSEVQLRQGLYKPIDYSTVQHALQYWTLDCNKWYLDTLVE